MRLPAPGAASWGSAMNDGEPRSASRDAIATLRARWQGLALRERRLVVIAAVALGLVLAWMLAVQPAWRTIERAAAERARVEAQWHEMQGLADEARELRATPPVDPGQARAALEAATERLGATGRLALQGDRAVLTLSGVGSGALRDWLAEVRSGARARPLEARLTRGSEGYSGTLVVAIGGGP